VNGTYINWYEIEWQEIEIVFENHEEKNDKF
jgi:hypothetical protein